ncbi:hypothetical protein P8625_14625 [Tenacibaculum tangerinum]|uniref:Uncharacterized protein n=1 Tax=Tenacibaculum tangerinum TaxID=3038772 RepID=A0ABY8L1X3_9FLAO|nr:hypothetical protein [Tenacibaculum tangerinum]WGH75289.1 hypothetical protein P8625_14625 [Tenacibaculum tangerinum]
MNSLLAGFSITIVATLLVHNSSDKLVNMIFTLVTFSVLRFIVAIIVNTTFKMMTTEGYLLVFKESRFFKARVASGVVFLGITSIVAMVSLSG